MKLRGKTKASERLDSRQRSWDRLSIDDKRATKRPGSRNPKKSSAIPAKHRS